MSQLSGVIEAADLPDAVAIDRITIPFFRIQERKWLLAGVDVALAAGVMLAGYKLWRLGLSRPPHELTQVPWEWVIGAALVWFLISWLSGGYELQTADRFPRAARSVSTAAVLTVAMGMVAYYLFLKTYPRPALVFDAVVLPLAVLGWRGVYATTLRRQVNATRLLVLGPRSFYQALWEQAEQRSSYYRVVGYLSDQPEAHVAYHGDLTQLRDAVARDHVHAVVVAPRQELSSRLVSALCACVERGVHVMDFNTAYEEIAEKVAVDHVDHQWLAALPTRPSTSRLEESALRLIDIAGGLLGLALTVVLGPCIAVAVLLEDRGPVFYRQVRVGRAGVPFTITKFRSMRTDAEAAGARWAASDDARTTRVGRFLRRTHLDELPQFWSVLTGDMSLVGPRPERPQFTDELSRDIPFYRLRMSVRPGLTGLKQIRVGYAASTEEHLEVLRQDLYYIKHRSLALNALILARTLGAVFGMRGR